MPKAKSIARIIDDAAVILQRIVRMKAADENGYCTCVSCGTKCHWKDMDGGHFIPRTYTAHKVCEENIHPQCKGCNGFRQEQAKVGYTLYMVDTYGRDFVDQLVASKRNITKRTRADAMALLADMKEYEKQVRKDKGFYA